MAIKFFITLGVACSCFVGGLSLMDTFSRAKRIAGGILFALGFVAFAIFFVTLP